MEQINVKLAKQFSRLLNKVVPLDEMAQANADNDAEGMSSDICHTHDYCDANEIMLQAFVKVNGREPNLQNENDACEINNAWDYAKHKHFKL